jgi:hypothetical protein
MDSELGAWHVFNGGLVGSFACTGRWASGCTWGRIQMTEEDSNDVSFYR